MAPKATRLEQDRAIWQFIGLIRITFHTGELSGQQNGHHLETSHGPGDVTASGKRVPDSTGHGAPLAGTDSVIATTIGNDFDGTVRKLHIHQHTVIGGGVPQVVLGEQFERAFTRRLPAPYCQQVKIRLDDETHLRSMQLLASANS